MVDNLKAVCRLTLFLPPNAPLAVPEAQYYRLVYAGTRNMPKNDTHFLK